MAVDGADSWQSGILRLRQTRAEACFGVPFVFAAAA